MTSNNYVTILGWMTNLDIKGNELIVYAVIHGFCQDKESYFHGSLKYLSEWTGTTEYNICDILKKLTEKGLLEKIQRDGTTNLYRTVNPFEEEVIEKSQEQSLEQNKDKDLDEEVTQIISYLNRKLNSRYRTNNPSTTRLIKSKLKNGFTVSDFISVIDTKYLDWYNDAEFSKYLRPNTLFGNKFETYLNQKIVSKQEYTIKNEVQIQPQKNISYNKIY